MPGTVRLHRVFACPPERIYRAFLDPDALAQWIPPEGFVCKVHHLDARVGGTFRMSFVNFGAQSSIHFGGEYLELVPAQSLRYTDVFDDPNLPGTMTVSVKLQAVSCGTEAEIEQSGIPDAIPVEHCYLGWQQSLNNLARLVTPNIPS